MGLIGRNGCGKSTTLKLLTKILKPNSGTVKVEGRVSSLIELGAGFHPDMSGRENIYINATIFGLKKKKLTSGLKKLSAFRSLKNILTIRCVPIRPVCICVLHSLLQLTLMPMYC